MLPHAAACCRMLLHAAACCCMLLHAAACCDVVSMESASTVLLQFLQPPSHTHNIKPRTHLHVPNSGTTLPTAQPMFSATDEITCAGRSSQGTATGAAGAAEGAVELLSSAVAGARRRGGWPCSMRSRSVGVASRISRHASPWMVCGEMGGGCAGERRRLCYATQLQAAAALQVPVCRSSRRIPERSPVQPCASRAHCALRASGGRAMRPRNRCRPAL